MNNTTLIRIGIGMILASVIALSIYFYRDNQKLKNENQLLEDTKIELQNEIKELDNKISELETLINDKNTELETKDKKVTELQNQIVKLNQLVERYKKEGKISHDKAQQYKGELEQKNYYIAKYQQEINRLKEENAQLKEQLGQMDSTLKEKDLVTEKLKEDLMLKETKLEAASILKAVNFKVYNINARGKEVWDEEYKHRQLHDVKVCFTVLENAAAETGYREIYVQILNPQKEILKNLKKSSGYFTYRQREQVYSTKAKVFYQKSDIQTCVVFAKPEELSYQKGIYEVIVYADGYIIGKSSFSVR